jgi:hypothetical protein
MSVGNGDELSACAEIAALVGRTTVEKMGVEKMIDRTSRVY